MPSGLAAYLVRMSLGAGLGASFCYFVIFFLPSLRILGVVDVMGGKVLMLVFVVCLLFLPK